MAAIHTQKHWLKTPRGELFVQSWVPSTEKDVPLILLHDSLGCVALWRDFPERLAETTGRRVVAYDRLGFGRSGKHPSILSANFICEEANEDFVSVCRQLGLRQYVTLGHSVGGGMAICCASVHLDACKGVISVAAQAFVDAGILDGIRAAKQNFSSFAQIDSLKGTSQKTENKAR